MVEVRRTLLGRVIPTQEHFYRNGSVTRFFQIPFDDDERCGFVAAPTMTRPRGVSGVAPLASSFLTYFGRLTWWFGLVRTLLGLLEFPFPLAVIRVTSLLLSTLFRISHPVQFGDQRNNPVARRRSTTDGSERCDRAGLRPHPVPILRKAPRCIRAPYSARPTKTVSQ